jgi:hypothetical protein
MKFERLNVSKVEIINNKMLYRSRKTPENMPPAGQLVALVGSRGVGKTTRICEWLMMYDNTKYYDKVRVISPTFTRDEKTKVLTSEPRNFKIKIVPKYTEDGFQGIMNYMMHEVDEYKKYLKEIEAWKRFLKCKSIDRLSNEDIAVLYALDFNPPTTEYKWGYPSFCIVVDDCVADKKLFSPTIRGTFTNFVLLHRHFLCTAILSSQVFQTGFQKD